MKKFLLIDDDPTRIGNYKKFFDFLELEYLENKAKLDSLNLSEYSGFILDVIYKPESDYKDMTFEYIVDILPPSSPIYVISSDWEEVMRNRKTEKFTQFLRNGQVLGLLSWETIMAEYEKGTTISKDYAKTNWITYHSLCLDAIPDNESLLILQISDLEFGNPKQNQFVKTAKHKLHSQIRNDAKKFGKNKIDFIIICGDIAFTGAQSQYLQAKEWLLDFSKDLINRYDMERRIIIAPGNHDINLDSILGNYYKIEYDDTVKAFKSDKREAYVPLFNNLGINNFARFVYDLTNDNSLLLRPKQPVIKRNFENLGVNFIMLDSVCFTEQMDFKYQLTDDYVSEILSNAKSINKDACNIIVSHFAPDYINVSDKTSDATDQAVIDLVDATNAKMWLYGHAHSRPVVDDIQIGSKGAKTCVSRACALMLQNVGICDGAKSGYSLLNLVRENGKVVKIEYLSKNDESGIQKKVMDTPFK